MTTDNTITPDNTTDSTSHLRPDGTTFPPVTPDPPLPPGYEPPQVGEVLPADDAATADEEASEPGARTDEPRADEPPD
jgi:hypothetical protein